jgi:hypothetical protein
MKFFIEFAAADTRSAHPDNPYNIATDEIILNGAADLGDIYRALVKGMVIASAPRHTNGTVESPYAATQKLVYAGFKAALSVENIASFRPMQDGEDYPHKAPCTVITVGFGRCGFWMEEAQLGTAMTMPFYFERPSLLFAHMRMKKWMRDEHAELAKALIVWERKVTGAAALATEAGRPALAVAGK